jgi:radical S-adenosyl methionine domain-containing protein 2
MKTEECALSSKDDPDSSNPIIPAVNFHLWQPCNFRCKFCFATFTDVKSEILPKGHLSESETIEVVRKLAASGLQKITFAGGEPTLCPWLPNLVKTAKAGGMTTGIITNGSKISPEYLLLFEGQLDWVGISIDSIIPETNQITGRALPGKNGNDAAYYLRLCRMVKAAGCRLKINTVVTSGNKKELLVDFIRQADPERWKVMRVLPVGGQNDQFYTNMAITDADFAMYCLNNATTEEKYKPITEDHENIIGSYLMVDPAGRFFDDTKGRHTYSEPILSVGVNKAMGQISYCYKTFKERKGLYDWK